jgi:hypothetical protein
MYLRSTYPYKGTRECTSTQVEMLTIIECSCSKWVLVYEYSFECEYWFGCTHKYSYSRVYTRSIPCPQQCPGPPPMSAGCTCSQWGWVGWHSGGCTRFTTYMSNIYHSVEGGNRLCSHEYYLRPQIFVLVIFVRVRISASATTNIRRRLYSCSGPYICSVHQPYIKYFTLQSISVV